MIDLIFALINLAVLIGLMAYIVRRFLYDKIQHSMVLEQATQLNLIKRQEALRKQEQSLVRAYYHQHYRYEEFSKKVELWRHHLEQQGQAKQAALEAAILRIQHVHNERNQHLQTQATCKQAVDAILINVRAQLHTEFAQRDTQHAYLRDILMHTAHTKDPHAS